MKVWIIEEDCPDPYFSPTLVGIYSTEEKARAYIAEQKCYVQDTLNVHEMEVDVPYNHQEIRGKYTSVNAQQAEGRMRRKELPSFTDFLDTWCFNKATDETS